MKNICTRFLSGLLAGMALFSGGTALAAEAAAEKNIPIDVCTINGSVYVKLEDAARAAGFTYTYDAALNTAVINPDEASSAAPAGKAGLTRNADGSINVPQDGSLYTPQAGDIIRCDDGTNYTITDVSRYDGNMFASGPVGPLPEPACDWSGFDQPELPKAEVRHFTVEGEEYLFVRNLYELRRMLYRYGMPEGRTIIGFWPWREELVTESLHSSPGGDYYLDVWDVYKNGIFQKTEYKLY
nr:hypothetical protein [uncultured Acetatifactor sp.]